MLVSFNTILQCQLPCLALPHHFVFYICTEVNDTYFSDCIGVGHRSSKYSFGYCCGSGSPCYLYCLLLAGRKCPMMKKGRFVDNRIMKCRVKEFPVQELSSFNLMIPFNCIYHGLRMGLLNFSLLQEMPNYDYLIL